MKTKDQDLALFQVGDRVRFQLGRRTLRGVVEEAGLMGHAGRPLYRVSVPADPDDDVKFTLAAEEMQADSTPRTTALEKAKVLSYLINGGLISILRTNTGGTGVPRVWLCLDSLGNVTHTFLPERGVVGGQTAPFFAFEGDRVFAAKQEEVAQFLESFGLSRAEANQVIREVGTAP